MKHIKLFKELNESIDSSLENELSKYLSTFEKYCEKKEKDNHVKERALELLDEIKSKPELKDKLYSWLTGETSTLVLQELLRQTTYKGNGNTPEQLRDFNAFSLLDTVCGYHKKFWEL